MFFDYSEYQKLIDLKKSPEDQFSVFFDGASKGNPGMVRAHHQRGIGFCFFDKKGKNVADFAINALQGTNNSAEYMGLLYSLFTAKLAGSPA